MKRFYSETHVKLGEKLLNHVFSIFREYRSRSIPHYIVDLIGFNLPLSKRLLHILRKEGPIYTYILYSLTNGVKILARPFTFDRCIIDEIFIHKCYTPQNFDEFSIKAGDVVIDLGAHIDVFLVFAAKMGASQVFAYEPLPQNFKLLLANIMLNNFQGKIKAFQKAITERRGIMTMNFDEMCMARLSLGGINRVRVKAITLNDVIFENKLDRVDFLKVDIEGSEWNVFRNLNKDTFSLIQKIAIESHSLANTRCLKNLLKERGFDVRIRRGGYPSLFYVYSLRKGW